MRNKISANAKYYKLDRLKIIDGHNSRTSKIDYLLEKSDYKNDNKLYGEGSLENVFEKSILRKRACQESVGYFKPPTGNENEIIETVIALSEEQARYYLDNNISLMKGYEQYMVDCKEKFGLEPIAISLHTDEGYIDENGTIKYNIHAHIIQHNYDFEKKKTVLKYMKKQDWRDMQDLAANSFQKVNLDFERGNSKLDNSKDHLERNDFISNKQNKLIEVQGQKILEQGQKLIFERNELQTIISEKENLKKELKKEYTNLNKIKNETKIQRDVFEKNSIEHTTLNNNVKSLQKLEKDKRDEYRNVDKIVKQHKNTQKGLEDRIDSLDKENIEKQALNDELDTSITKKEKIFKNQKSVDNIFIKRVNEIVEKNDSILGINHKNLKIDIVKELKKVSGLNVNLETSRKDRMAANDANIEKKDIEKRYVQLLEDNEQLEDLLLKERLLHKNTKDNSIQKEIINGILEKSNMPNLSELEKMQKKKEDLEKEERKKSNSNMRFR